MASSAAPAAEILRHRGAAGWVLLQATALTLQAEFFRYATLFADQPYVCLLDSAAAQAGLGRYSFLSAEPWLVLRAARVGDSQPAEAELSFEYREPQPRREIRRGAAFAEAARLLRELSLPSAVRARLPWPFIGGAVGYVGYEAGRFSERLPGAVLRDLELPDVCLMFVDEVLVHDRETASAWLVITARAASEPDALAHLQARQEVWRVRLAAFEATLSAELAPTPPPTAAVSGELALQADRNRAEYCEMVVRAREHILAGDAFEICTTYRMQTPCPVASFRLYELLRGINPAPLASYLRLPEVCLVSSSPERFLRLGQDRVAETRPIKGTRPRGSDAAHDASLRAELAASEKDRAEQLMIVDLARNDLGRVCELDSVHVPELLTIEAHASVFQLVSTVRGRLRTECDAFDLLRACFPPGSMTGAPKIEAMKIIDALEAHERGIYSGCVGYFDVGGGLDLSVVIRSFVLYQGSVYIGVGGAVVADSSPEAEYTESVVKAQALLDTLRAAGSGDVKLLLLDNYDSFVWNLAHALGALGAQVQVVRNDAWTLAEVRANAPSAAVISPGPGRPEDPRYFGVCEALIRELGASLPILGVCLGHQGIVHACGGKIVRATRVMHGKTSAIVHDGSGLFAGLPQGFVAMRYHSLVADPTCVPACLRVCAHSDDGTIMAVAHTEKPLYGVQFHPESIGTPEGRLVLDNFLRLARNFAPA